MSTRNYCIRALLLGVAWTCAAQAREASGNPGTAMVAPAMNQETPAGNETEAPGLTLQQAIERTLASSPRLLAFSKDLRAADARILQAGLRANPDLSLRVEEVRWTTGPSEYTRTGQFSGQLQRGTRTVPTGGSQNPLQIPVLKANPLLGGEREAAQGTRSGFSEAELTVTIAYVIELGAKRARRVTLAEREKDALRWSYETVRADVLARTGTAFVNALAAQENLSLQDDLLRLARQAADVAARRVAAGAASPLEQNRAEIALVATEVGREQAQRRVSAAYAALAAMWGEREPRFPGVSGTLDRTGPVPSVVTLEQELENNPDVARWATELASREAAWKSEQAKAIPNLTVEFGFRSTGTANRSVRRAGLDSGGGFSFGRSDSDFSADRDNRLVMGFSLPLPIFDRNQGNVAEAEHMIAKTGHERRAAEAEAWVLLTGAREDAAAALDEIERLTGQILPKAEETFTKTQQGYELGKFGYLDVLDAERTLFAARTSRLDALLRYHTAIIQMERLTGRAIREWPRPAENSEKGKWDAN